MLAFALGSCRESPVSPNGSEAFLGRTVFVTSATFTGSLGGIEVADQACTMLAVAAGLSGRFRAWISDSSGLSPSETFNQGNVPFVMTSGVRVADHWTDLTDGTINNPIVVDEHGRQPDSVAVIWTGTTASGQALTVDATCAGWSDASAGAMGQVGEVDAIGPAWSSSRKAGCDQLGRLYCFQQ